MSEEVHDVETSEVPEGFGQEPETEEGQVSDQESSEQEPEQEAAPQEVPAAEETDWEKRYQDSSREAHNLNEQIRQQRELNEGLAAIVRHMQNGKQEPATPKQEAPAPQPYGPYGTEAEMRAAFQADFSGTLNRMMEHNIMSQFGGKKPNEVIEEGIREGLKPHEEHQRREARLLQGKKLQTDFPELADTNSPERKACAELLNSREHGEWLNELETCYPEVDVPRVAFKLANFDLLQQKVKSLESQLGERRVRAGTARTGSGSRGTPKRDKSARGLTEMAADTLRAQGVDVDPAVVEAAAAAFEDHNI